MPKDQTLNILLTALRETDIAYDEDELKAALQSSPEARAWIQECLTHATLLSKEESQLYLSLENAGVADNLSSAFDLTVVRAVNDEEITNAIQELNRSTTAIEEQSDILKIQQDAMLALMESNAKTQQSRSQRTSAQAKRWKDDLDRTNASIEELNQALQLGIADLEKETKTADNTLKQTAAELLHADDRLLAGLQKLSSDLDPGDPGEDEAMARLRTSCARLIKYTVEGIRTRLDRVYLESTSSNLDSQSDGEVAALQEELESLYSEILPVAQMSTEQQYLQPALRAVAAADVHGKGRSVKALQYIANCIEIITQRLDAFLARVREFQAHKRATALVVDKIRAEVRDNSDISLPSVSTPKREQFNSRPKSPVRKPRQSFGIEDELEPEKQLLNRLGISSTGNDEAIVEALGKALAERKSKVTAHSHSIQSSMESNIVTYVHNAFITLQLLQDSLLSETSTKTMQLLDLDAELLLQDLEKELKDVQESAAALDRQKLQERSVSREKFIERWR